MLFEGSAKLQKLRASREKKLQKAKERLSFIAHEGDSSELLPKRGKVPQETLLVQEENEILQKELGELQKVREHLFHETQLAAGKKKKKPKRVCTDGKSVASTKSKRTKKKKSRDSKFADCDGIEIVTGSEDGNIVDSIPLVDRSDGAVTKKKKKSISGEASVARELTSCTKGTKKKKKKKLSGDDGDTVATSESKKKKKSRPSNASNTRISDVKSKKKKQRSSDGSVATTGTKKKKSISSGDSVTSELTMGSYDKSSGRPKKAERRKKKRITTAAPLEDALSIPKKEKTETERTVSKDETEPIPISDEKKNVGKLETQEPITVDDVQDEPSEEAFAALSNDAFAAFSNDEDYASEPSPVETGQVAPAESKPIIGTVSDDASDLSSVDTVQDEPSEEAFAALSNDEFAAFSNDDDYASEPSPVETGQEAPEVSKPIIGTVTDDASSVDTVQDEPSEDAFAALSNDAFAAFSNDDDYASEPSPVETGQEAPEVSKPIIGTVTDDAADASSVSHNNSSTGDSPEHKDRNGPLNLMGKKVGGLAKGLKAALPLGKSNDDDADDCDDDGPRKIGLSPKRRVQTLSAIGDKVHHIANGINSSNRDNIESDNNSENDTESPTKTNRRLDIVVGSEGGIAKGLKGIGKANKDDDSSDSAGSEVDDSTPIHNPMRLVGDKVSGLAKGLKENTRLHEVGDKASGLTEGIKAKAPLKAVGEKMGGMAQNLKDKAHLPRFHGKPEASEDGTNQNVPAPKREFTAEEKEKARERWKLVRLYVKTRATFNMIGTLREKASFLLNNDNEEDIADMDPEQLQKIREVEKKKLDELLDELVKQEQKIATERLELRSASKKMSEEKESLELQIANLKQETDIMTLNLRDAEFRLEDFKDDEYEAESTTIYLELQEENAELKGRSTVYKTFIQKLRDEKLAREQQDKERLIEMLEDAEDSKSVEFHEDEEEEEKEGDSLIPGVRLRGEILMAAANLKESYALIQQNRLEIARLKAEFKRGVHENTQHITLDEIEEVQDEIKEIHMRALSEKENLLNKIIEEEESILALEEELKQRKEGLNPQGFWGWMTGQPNEESDIEEKDEKEDTIDTAQETAQDTLTVTASVYSEHVAEDIIHQKGDEMMKKMLRESLMV